MVVTNLDMEQEESLLFYDFEECSFLKGHYIL